MCAHGMVRKLPCRSVGFFLDWVLQRVSLFLPTQPPNYLTLWTEFNFFLEYLFFSWISFPFSIEFLCSFINFLIKKFFSVHVLISPFRISKVSCPWLTCHHRLGRNGSLSPNGLFISTVPTTSLLVRISSGEHVSSLSTLWQSTEYKEFSKQQDTWETST